MMLYHSTKGLSLPNILRHRALWPAPPLRAYGLIREEVEHTPDRFGFQVRRSQGRRSFSNDRVPHPDRPGRLSAASWFEGQVFDVPLTRADWCFSVMSYFPQEMLEGGAFWRLVVATDGLDLPGWREYQQRANVTAAYRRDLAAATRRVGGDPHDWHFHFGEMPLADRLVEVEQYHQGRWTPLSDVFERAPLAEMRWARLRFEATYIRAGFVPGLIGTSLFTGVSLDGRFVADHLWVHQTWGHLAAGDRCCFYATVVPYTRRGGTTGWTLDDVNCLVVLRDGG